MSSLIYNYLTTKLNDSPWIQQKIKHSREHDTSTASSVDLQTPPPHLHLHHQHHPHHHERHRNRGVEEDTPAKSLKRDRKPAGSDQWTATLFAQAERLQSTLFASDSSSSDEKSTPAVTAAIDLQRNQGS